MERIPIQDHSFPGPTAVTVEASDETIFEQNLDPLNGEQYDFLRDILSITVADNGDVSFVSCRTIERPDRGTLTLPRKALKAIYI